MLNSVIRCRNSIVGHIRQSINQSHLLGRQLPVLADIVGLTRQRHSSRAD